ncbi:energy-coupling factor ABC transporter ATP-binding protein [Nonomuraea sp. NPDC050790]|uniref:energy-coupling factor ABC transporter ATP-binding protein n=1 Tax=Nonomuraea sp. NPDC050790 TaxID=3364371 RepID=UPI0037B7C646
MIELADVTYTYKNGVRALDGVSFTAGTGRVVCVLGHNGAGKSTLMRTMNGLLRPSAGTVTVDGVNVAKLRPAKAAALVGVSFQNPDSQLFSATVLDELRFGARQGTDDASAAEVEVRRAADLLGLGKVLDANPYSLPLSLRKRVAIASVVAMRTPNIVLDEPTGNLDRYGGLMVADLIQRLKADKRTVVVVTHDIDLAHDHADQIVVMSHGTVRLAGDPAEVFADERLASAGVSPPTPHQIAAHLPGGPRLDSLEDLLAWAKNAPHKQGATP